MTKHRHTASTITDDTLDRLYDNASRGWRRGDGWKRRALKAEAAADRPAVLTEAERTMLAYALDQAQEKIWSEDGFTDADQAAVDSLRRLAAKPEENSTP